MLTRLSGRVVKTVKPEFAQDHMEARKPGGCVSHHLNPPGYFSNFVRVK